MKTEITLFEEKTVTSLDLVDQINLFRQQFNEDVKVLLHKTFITKIVKELQASKDVNIGAGQNIMLSSYKDKSGKKSTMYTLSHTTALLLAATEVAQVRVLVGQWIDDLKHENKALKKSINDVLIERLDNGERKIIKRFITDTINASGYSGLRTAVSELNKSATGKPWKEWLLTQLCTTFEVYINSMSIKEYKKISIEADKVELELKHTLKNFLSYSRGQSLRAIKKEYKKLRVAKNAVTNAYLNMKPKSFTGDFQVEMDEETGERIYLIGNEELDMVISPTSFIKDDETIYYMSGTIHIKEDSLYLDVTGALDGNIFRTKTKDLDKAQYEAIVSVSLTTFKYNVVIVKLK